MTLLALSTALALQAQPGPATAAADTLPVFDTPATRALVARVTQTGSTVPPELRDYTARLKSAVYLSLAQDSATAGDVPVTVDEFAGEVRWERGGSLEQIVRGHRVRQIAPTPYTLGTVIDNPWVIPHLYGNTIDVFQLAPTPSAGARIARAVHPFSYRGFDIYRYTAGDTLRIRTREGTTTLVPIEVRPRMAPSGREQWVAGTFYVDVDRAAVARARFGFAQRGGFALTETGVFFELESGLVENRFWLPFRQRREFQITSPLFGGAAAIRLITQLSDFRVNTGWTPEMPGRARLVRAGRAPGAEDPFASWSRTVGEELGLPDISDFADLRETVRPAARTDGVRITPRYERADQLARYNRVEGAFLGLGLRAEPRDPRRRSWEVYGTGGYAFSENTARGDLAARWRPDFAQPRTAPRRTLSLALYRRLIDPQVFRPPFRWETGYSLNAALAGVDERDYYDASGVELSAQRTSGPWTLRLGGRVERQDSVSVNTTRTLLGSQARRFPDLAPIDEGDNLAAEGELRYVAGPPTGAFSIGRSTVLSLRGESGFGDFRFTRLVGQLATRRPSRFITLALRADAGTIFGDPSLQSLFRFGGSEGLRGYPLRAFGGTTAALARGRLLLHLPPYGSEPLFRIGFFAFPPLRPALVASANTGWASARNEAERAQLLRLGAAPTGGWKASYGGGVSILEDAVSAEYIRPADGGRGRWYFGFVQWF